MIRIASTLILMGGLLSAPLTSQGRPEGAPRFSKKQIVKAFDNDKNGRLTGAERAAAIAWIREDLVKNPPRRRGSRPAPESELESYKVAKDSVKHYGDRELYDSSVVRTVFVDFANANWSDDMKLFYRTDIDEPATVTVDGVVYPGVGVHFRGSSSYFSVVNRDKKSMSLSFDHEDGKQRLGGCKAVNLLSAHADPSYMRTVLFAHIVGNYVKMPKACFVHLVINGESWGLYINDQQLNKDFIEQAFGTRKGSRWKIGPNFNGESALAYQGPDRSDYQSKYELKSGKKKKSWRALTLLCQTLSESSPEDLEKNLPAMLDIEHTLWFLALDNVLMDGDGYHYRGSDYAIYLHPNGKFYPLFRDNNESFNYGGGPGGFGRKSGEKRPRGAIMDPLKLVDEERAALSSKLMAVPKWRAQYLDHCRLLRDTWVDWQKVGPIVARWRRMIEPIVKKDDKGLYGYEAFKAALVDGSERTPGLEQFFKERRAFLDETPSLKK
ncbi:MAG: hypothetical protein ACI89X_003904 [Planctomycetota bacterium]|jgi:hypothetical protein